MKHVGNRTHLRGFVTTMTRMRGKKETMGGANEMKRGSRRHTEVQREMTERALETMYPNHLSYICNSMVVVI